VGVLLAGEIIKAVDRGDIVIDPFDPRPTKDGGHLGPNSYDVRLGDEILQMGTPDIGAGWWVDLNAPVEWMKVKRWEPTKDRDRPHFVLFPEKFYLAVTLERVGTERYVPWIDGRSTVGRYGLAVHVTAGRGDVGFDGHWTLELKNLSGRPMVIYPGMRIAQMTFFDGVGSLPDEYRYAGRYSHQTGPKTPVAGNF
jgi:dCTP deaminase